MKRNSDSWDAHDNTVGGPCTDPEPTPVEVKEGENFLTNAKRDKEIFFLPHAVLAALCTLKLEDSSIDYRSLPANVLAQKLSEWVRGISFPCAISK